MTDFVNITSGDNWFKQHPNKIAGVEFESTSFHFPIQVRGKREDVERVINATLSDLRVDTKKSDKLKRLKLAKAKAKALKLKLII